MKTVVDCVCFHCRTRKGEHLRFSCGPNKNSRFVSLFFKWTKKKLSNIRRQILWIGLVDVKSNKRKKNTKFYKNIYLDSVWNEGVERYFKSLEINCFVVREKNRNKIFSIETFSGKLSQFLWTNFLHLYKRLRRRLDNSANVKARK